MIEMLEKQVELMDVNLTKKQLEQLITLLDELLKWNKTYNLTAITDQKEALKLHIIDSLAIVPYWDFNKTLDVGTGAGFPGLVLAIALPEQEFHLLDSNSKKIRFLRHMIYKLGLRNVTVHHGRVEDLNKADLKKEAPNKKDLNIDSLKYDAIVSRAFASLSDMIKMTRHLLAEDGRWMAMKSNFIPDGEDPIPKGIKLQKVNKLTLPDLSVKRCLIELSELNH